MRVVGSVAAIALLAIAASAVLQEPFPHAAHEGLFPLCTGCHAGIDTGEADAAYPDPDVCTRCHDGEREQRVTWTGPRETASNLRFSHPSHRSEVARAGGSADCATCHGTGEPGRMQVAGAAAESCLSCHAHEAPSHLAEERDCRSCHVPLVEAEALTGARIAGFERPAAHDAAGYLLRHGPPDDDASRCAVCHARESCARCHANAADLPAIVALEPDARIAGLVAGTPPEYPEPADHRAGTWDVLHGSAANVAATGCANCHTRDSCSTCHASGAIGEELPTRAADDPRGVRIAAPSMLHAPGYAERHGTDAAARTATCASCHDEAQCEACHTAGTTPSFHEPDYVARHGPAAYAADTECVSCHSTEVFCRSCHDDTGLGASDRTGVAFHTNNPFWLVGHGAAARQGLAACATCHGQDSCMRCHSARGSWRISPHGPGFDAGRAQDANPITCRLCHPAGVIR